jgi:tartrate dehydrogenase/decarboxylase / D-malate dehydrogenase
VSANGDRFRIAVIPGDGIGKEVVPEGLRVLERLAEQSSGALAFTFESFPWGCEHYLETGVMMDADGLAICQGFDQYVCLRPVRLLPGVESPLRNASPDTMDWIVVRENSEGEYAGVGGRNFAGRGQGKEIAVQAALFTDHGCERIIRYAFELATTRPKRKVTSVTKSNAQQYGMVLWDEVFARVAGQYPDVETNQWLVDAMAARFVLKPETLDVVVASNLFGDILSDLGSALAGSLGIAAGANIDPERRHPSMFEPVHGSAPDIAGQGIANPIAAIWTVALMLDHLGRAEEADQVMRAIEATTASGMLTPDLGGSASTHDVGDAILANL